MIKAQFTNGQGEKINNGLFKIVDAHFHSSDSKHFSVADSQEANNFSNSLRYRVFYWKTQADLDAGYDAYIFNSPVTVDDSMSENGDTRTIEDKLWHEARNLGPEFTSLGAEAMAEKHLAEVVTGG